MRNVKHQWKLVLAPWALLGVSMSWGLAFVVMKDAVERQSVTNFLFTRFCVAVMIMLLIRPKVFKVMNRGLVLRGGAAGLFLGIGYIFQTFGLERAGAAITVGITLG